MPSIQVESQEVQTRMNSNFDLTPLMAPFLDVHMVSPLLDFLRDVQHHDPKVVTKEKIKSIARTNMIELLEDEYQRFPDDSELHNEFEAIKPQLEAKKNAIFDRMDNPPESVKVVSEFFANKSLISTLQGQANFTLEYISSKHDISSEALDSYYKFSKFKYECGMYGDAEEMLENYLSIAQSQNSTVLGALWGRLACRILQAKWEESLKDLAAVKDAIDSRSIAPIDQIRQRAWLLHWGLFVYINQRNGPDALVDLFTEKAYLQTIENLCPWLLRYYTVAIILSPIRRRTGLREVLQEISSMSYQYSDPVTLFLESLFNQFDFDEAQQRLKECQALVSNDFFLQIFADRFTREARVLICEMYCTINRRVDLKMLADKLQLTEEEAEKWMVDMGRGSTEGATMDVKIDSAAKQVIMAAPSHSVHQAVADKTRDLTARSATLSSNIQKIMIDQAQYMLAK